MKRYINLEIVRLLIVRKVGVCSFLFSVIFRIVVRFLINFNIEMDIVIINNCFIKLGNWLMFLVVMVEIVNIVIDIVLFEKFIFVKIICFVFSMEGNCV